MRWPATLRATSHRVHPQTIDPILPLSKGRPIAGAGGRMAPQDAGAAFGKKTFEAAVDMAVAEAKHRLANGGMRRGHDQGRRDGPRTAKG